MTLERRKSNRMSINVTIKLNSVRSTGDLSKLNKDEIEVDLVDISKDGIGFCCDEELETGTFYDTEIVLWTKERFNSVVEIVRKVNKDDGRKIYGCRFIGIMPSDQLKIQIYEMISARDGK